LTQHLSRTGGRHLLTGSNSRPRVQDPASTSPRPPKLTRLRSRQLMGAESRNAATTLRCQCAIRVRSSVRNGSIVKIPYAIPYFNVFESTSKLSATIATRTEGDTTSASPKIVLHEETTTCGGDLATIVLESGPPLGARLSTQHPAGI
jgi:hypothetical protein